MLDKLLFVQHGQQGQATAVAVVREVVGLGNTQGPLCQDEGILSATYA
jgi:hypothetical protein